MCEVSRMAGQACAGLGTCSESKLKPIQELPYKVKIPTSTPNFHSSKPHTTLSYGTARSKASSQAKARGESNAFVQANRCLFSRQNDHFWRLEEHLGPYLARGHPTDKVRGPLSQGAERVNRSCDSKPAPFSALNRSALVPE